MLATGENLCISGQDHCESRSHSHCVILCRVMAENASNRGISMGTSERLNDEHMERLK